MSILIKLVVNAVAIFITARLLTGVVLDDLKSAIFVAVVLALINTFIKPILLFFTLPINIMTLGLFTFVINALLVMVASYLVEGFAVPNFWWALAFSFVLSIINSILIWIVK